MQALSKVGVIQYFKLRYLSILIIYFCYGFSTFTTISAIFWTKNFLNISAIELVQINFWVCTIPWTFKIVFSQFIESVSIFGNKRKSYIIIGAIFNGVGNIILISLANGYTWVNVVGPIYHQLLVSGVLIMSGFLIQDLVASTLCLELVENGQNQSTCSTEVKDEIGKVQVIGKMSFMLGTLLGTALGGYVADRYRFSDIVWFTIFIPLCSAISVFRLNVKLRDHESCYSSQITLVGVILILSSILSEFIKFPYNQEITFLVNLLFISLLLKLVCTNTRKVDLREIILIGIMIFAFRLDPPLGAGIKWWQIDVLKFDPEFFGLLRQVGYLLGFVSMWIFSSYLIKKDIASVVTVLAIINAILILPHLGMAYGLHEWTEAYIGFGARTIALIDPIIESPATSLMMVPISALSAYYAPNSNRATWFALTACWLNLATSGATLISKYLNKIFVIERGQYTEIPHLIMAKILIGFFLPIVVVFICNKFRKFLNNYHESTS
ncbi:conserved membrane hypothetical protein [Alphaproteobacteria bacterium]